MSSEIHSMPGESGPWALDSWSSKFELRDSKPGTQAGPWAWDSAAPDLSSDIQSLGYQVHELEVQQQKIGALEQLWDRFKACSRRFMRCLRLNSIRLALLSSSEIQSPGDTRSMRILRLCCNRFESSENIQSPWSWPARPFYIWHNNTYMYIQKQICNCLPDPRIWVCGTQC